MYVKTCSGENMRGTMLASIWAILELKFELWNAFVFPGFFCNDVEFFPLLLRVFTTAFLMWSETIARIVEALNFVAV